jgi:hypothetical protein
LTRQNNLSQSSEINEANSQDLATDNDATGKKLFVEPSVSVPTDVLEATTFFQQPTIESSTV